MGITVLPFTTGSHPYIMLPAGNGTSCTSCLHGVPCPSLTHLRPFPLFILGFRRWGLPGYSAA